MRKQMNIILLGDPSQGGFRGVNYCGSNNDLAWGQSPNMYNYLVSNTGLTKRKGCAKDNATEIGSGTGITGLHRFFDGADYKTFVKIGTQVYDLKATGSSPWVMDVIEAGDANNQLSGWIINGAHAGNTNAGVLYWKLTNSGTIRTVDLYKNSDGLDVDKVATGSKDGNGSIILSPVNSSGISGSVTVTYSADDTDLANNTLTFRTLGADTEIHFADWLGYCFFADGVNLWRLGAGGFESVTWLDEDGLSTATWGLLPTPVALVLHKDHLWWFDKDSSRVGFTVRGYYDRVYEDTLNASNYGSWIACDQDDGQHLTALIRVPLADCLMAFKRQKSFFITGDFDSVNDTLAVISGPPTGAYSQTCVIACPDGFVRWYGPDGIWQYRQDTGSICISRNKQLQLDIDAELQKILPQNRPKCCMGYWDHYLLFFYPYGTSTYNDRGLAFDTVRMEWMPIRGWNVSRLCVFEDGTIHAGWSNAGYVKKLFVNDNDDGLPISCYYETKYYGQPQVEQVLDSMRAKVTAGRTLILGWRSDPAINISRQITFSYGDPPVLLGDEENPTDADFQLGDETIPGTGDILSDLYEEEIAIEYATRLSAGQRFREIQFFIQESSALAHSLDFMEIRTYPRRLVV